MNEALDALPDLGGLVDREGTALLGGIQEGNHDIEGDVVVGHGDIREENLGLLGGSGCVGGILNRLNSRVNGIHYI